MSEYIPPWSSPYIIGIAGLSGSGKTTVAQEIIKSINEPWTILLSLDNFYKELTPELSAKAFNNEYDFDHPDAIDLDLIYECVKSIKNGKKTEIPMYSFSNHQRIKDQSITIYGANVIIIEGIFTLFKKELLDLMDCKVFVDTDIDICYSRRLLRDIVHRGRDIKSVIEQWDAFVKPNAILYVLPTRSNADIVIPRGSDNYIALELLIEHLKNQLKIKSTEHINHLKMLGLKINPINWDNVTIIEETNQVKVIKTILLNKETKNDIFSFYFDRIASILINESLNFVRYVSGDSIGKTIETPINVKINPTDVFFQLNEIIAVSIIRSGDCFIKSLRRTIPAAKIGKLLIQTDSRTGEPQLHTEKLPIITKNSQVLLFDAQTISGAASIMAIKILLDHNVDENNIILVNYTTTELAIKRIFHAFPKIKIVTACVGGHGSTDSDNDWWMCHRFIDNIYYGTN